MVDRDGNLRTLVLVKFQSFLPQLGQYFRTMFLCFLIYLMLADEPLRTGYEK